jgi:prepilin-type N-terminal cleavage/methylation domain-containing protein
MSSLKRFNKQGFTVIEIMCVLIIISIVSSIALPAINNFHSSDRCKAEASVLVSYIRQAKYQALQDNCLNRLIFSPENDSDTGNVFKIQKYEFKNVTNPFSFDEIINGEVDDVDAYDYDGEYWVSIADTEEVEINSSVEVDTSSLSTLPTITDGSTGTDKELKVIYFKPDGFLYDANNEMISEQRIVFKYGSSAVAVDVNAIGVISSEAIPIEEEDFDDNEGKEEDEDES